MFSVVLSSPTVGQCGTKFIVDPACKEVERSTSVV